jgi:hypothetical protein
MLVICPLGKYGQIFVFSLKYQYLPSYIRIFPRIQLPISAQWSQSTRKYLLKKKKQRKSKGTTKNRKFRCVYMSNELISKIIIFCCNMFVFACPIVAESQCWLFALWVNMGKYSYFPVIVLSVILSFFFWSLCCLSFCPFSFGHCFVCHFVLFLLVIVLSVILSFFL